MIVGRIAAATTQCRNHSFAVLVDAQCTQSPMVSTVTSSSPHLMLFVHENDVQCDAMHWQRIYLLFVKWWMWASGRWKRISIKSSSVSLLCFTVYHWMKWVWKISSKNWKLIFFPSGKFRNSVRFIQEGSASHSTHMNTDKNAGVILFSQSVMWCGYCAFKLFTILLLFWLRSLCTCTAYYTETLTTPIQRARIHTHQHWFASQTHTRNRTRACQTLADVCTQQAWLVWKRARICAQPKMHN